MYDVIVVGGGHAGCEAALAAARMGLSVLMLTLRIDDVGQLSCNPAMGGLAKGHLVREIDALGGEMGKATDRAGIQFRMLNRSKGPAVWAPRAQVDRGMYRREMRRRVEGQERLWLKQGHVTRVVVEGGRVRGVEMETGYGYEGSTVILATGTFLEGQLHVGLKSWAGGRASEPPAVGLSACLRELGLRVGRLKTGTPPRVDSRTVDVDRMEEQRGDEEPVVFSWGDERIVRNVAFCYSTRTCERTHEVIRGGLDRSPLYSGKIVGVGPRYCPSIEDKVVRFAEREGHQVFLEPEGLDSVEMYVNGFATSLPEDVQLTALRTVKGLEEVEITRPGYAVEYDFVPASQLEPWLEVRGVQGLFLAGQINGTSGYEEAGAQGIMAGINAALRVCGEKPFVLKRWEAYTGVLIDDLVTMGPEEPYRMFTSRAEYRLLLREDNADERLVKYGRQFGLVDQARYEEVEERRQRVEAEVRRLKTTRVDAQKASYVIGRVGGGVARESLTLVQLLKRPKINYEDLIEVMDGACVEDRDIQRRVEIAVKYEGYVARQMAEVERMEKMEEWQIPVDLDYNEIIGLSAEARQKLMEIRPLSLGQAARIAGVRAADASVLLVYLEVLRRRTDKKQRNVSRETFRSERPR